MELRIAYSSSTKDNNFNVVNLASLIGEKKRNNLFVKFYKFFDTPEEDLLELKGLGAKTLEKINTSISDHLKLSLND